MRLTVGQAVVRFLAAQRSERDGSEHRLFAGCSGIFGHGNVAGIGQALLEAELLDTERPEAKRPEAEWRPPERRGGGTGLRYYQARNE